MAENQLLGEEDVLLYINDLFSMGLSRESLAQPSATVICELYDLFLTGMGITVGTPDLEAAQGIEDIEKFDEWIYKTNMLHAIQYILANLNFQGEFTMLDLIQPKRKKNIRILNYLIHAACSVDELRKSFWENAKGFEEKKKDKDKLLLKIDTLKKTLEKKGAIAGHCRSKRPALDKQLLTIGNEYETKKAIGAELTNQYRAEKKELTAKKEELSELEVKLGELREEIAVMEAQVVKSPEKVKAEVTAKETMLELKMSEKRKLTKEYSEMLEHSENVQKASQDMIPIMDTLRETISDMDAFKVKCSAIDDIKDTIKTKELKAHQQKVVIKQSNSNIDALKDQLKKSVSKQTIRMKPIQSLLQGVNEQIKKREDSESGPSKDLVIKERSLHQEIEEIKEERANIERVIKSVHERMAVAQQKLKQTIQGK